MTMADNAHTMWPMPQPPSDQKSSKTPTQEPAVPPQDDPVIQTSDPVIEELKAKLAKLTDIAARAQADLLNFKDRMKRESDELRKFAIVPLILQLLPMYDDLSRAAAHEKSGTLQILAKLERVLADASVKRIEALEKKADPAKHEIVNTGPGEQDVVTHVHEEGFELYGRVLRPAKVQVGDGTGALSPKIVEPS